MKKKSGILILTAVTLLFIAACGHPSEAQTPSGTPVPSDSADYRVIFLTSGTQAPISAVSYDLLHTVITVSLYDSSDYELLRQCFALINEYEHLLSRTMEDTEIYRLNHSETGRLTVSDRTRELVELSLYYGALTHGALDISIAPISALWDFVSGTNHVPSEEAISALLPLVDYEKVSVEGNDIVLMPGMQLELGAVAKGFIADRVKEFLEEQGVSSAVIDLGGNVLLLGEKPDGSAFRVGIQKPFEDRNSVVVAISELRDVSMVSSGIYERYFTGEDGTFYHHILNPQTGYPCRNDLLQVTIVSPDSVTGDALSTSCFALGLDEGLALINSIENVYAVFLTADGTLVFSDGYLTAFPTETE